MKPDRFIGKFLRRGGTKITDIPIENVPWDWYGAVRAMTADIDYDCEFKKFAPGCKRYQKSDGMCCCGGCHNAMGYITVLPNDYTILKAIAGSFIDTKEGGKYDPKGVGFWEQGKGCQLPRRYRSVTCLRHFCSGKKKMPENHRFLLKEMLYPSRMLHYQNAFLEMYPSYGGRIPLVRTPSEKFKRSFWSCVDILMERHFVNVNTPEHAIAERTTLSEIEQAIMDGDWKKLRNICSLYGPFGPVDDSFRLHEIIVALIDRCKRHDCAGSISLESAIGLSHLLIANKKTGTVHVSVPDNYHGTLCNTWSWDSDMYKTTSKNITCKRCLNLLKIRRNI